MPVSAATTVLRSDSTSGRARLAGTGVMRPTQWLDSAGDSTGTGSTRRFGRPATEAYRCIMSKYVRTSGPPMSKRRLTSSGSEEHATR